MHHLSIDIETYSSVDIQKSGLYKYVQSGDFEILLFAYSLDGAPVRIVDLTAGETIPEEIRGLMFSQDCVLHAYNAAFEWYCLSKYFCLTELAKNLWLSQWRCTMLHGLYCGFPSGLAAIGDAIGLPQDKKKMSIGKALITYFCKPCKPTSANGNRTRNLPHHAPDKWTLFIIYCIQDVVTEMSVESKLSAFPVPEDVQRQWELDQRINAYGVRLDLGLVSGAVSCSEKINAELMEEAMRITGLDNPKSVAQLKKWLEAETDSEIDNLSKATVSGMLDKGIPQENVKRVLQLRQELSKSSVKKYTAMENAVCRDGRARGLIQFYGANRTGRWAGRLIQVQNLPRTYIEDLSLARDFAKNSDNFMLQFTYGSVPDTLSQLIRTAFIPSEGNKFVVADFSAIEARVIAWLAGESWRQEVFATHGKIYEASASQMFHVPIERIKKGNPEYALRAKGKVAELALGYQGSVGALINMGALSMGLSEEELPDIVSAWREANPRIKDLWYAMEQAALDTVKNFCPNVVKCLTFRYEFDPVSDIHFMTITLPSGRRLFYPSPTILDNNFGKPAVHYMGQDGNSKKWGQLSTYGGKLTENVVQAIARDCLAVTLERLDQAGYKTVMHIHDEAVIDCPAENANLEDVCELMRQPIPWAPGLLLNADGFVGDYYKKE
ncbi:MAG: DNA polymerase [Oscillospiraceae bacterium]|nr:DNA polymerase [Oscillospiraceae bacterium]